MCNLILWSYFTDISKHRQSFMGWTPLLVCQHLTRHLLRGPAYNLSRMLFSQRLLYHLIPRSSSMSSMPQKGSPILLLGVLHAVLRRTILKEAESFLLRIYGELTYQALKKRAKLISFCGMRKLEILRYALPLVIFTTTLHAHIITKTGLGPARQGVSWFCTVTIHILS